LGSAPICRPTHTCTPKLTLQLPNQTTHAEL